MAILMCYEQSKLWVLFCGFMDHLDHKYLIHYENNSLLEAYKNRISCSVIAFWEDKTSRHTLVKTYTETVVMY